MTTVLAQQPSNAPLPTGAIGNIRDADYGTVARSTDGDWMYAGPGNANGMQIGPFQHPYRFWIKCGASYIVYCAGGWERFDWKLWLLNNTTGTYAPDLNGIAMFQKAHSSEGTGHPDPWLTANSEALFYCEANQQYYVRLLCAGGTGYYYQSNQHMNMWAHTIGEGVY